MMTPAIFQLPAPVGEVLARLAAAGFDAWCVGAAFGTPFWESAPSTGTWPPAPGRRRPVLSLLGSAWWKWGQPTAPLP